MEKYKILKKVVTNYSVFEVKLIAYCKDDDKVYNNSTLYSEETFTELIVDELIMLSKLKKSRLEHTMKFNHLELPRSLSNVNCDNVITFKVYHYDELGMKRSLLVNRDYIN